MSADARPQKAGQHVKGTDSTGAPHDLLTDASGVLQVSGGASTIANGADVAEGSTTDAPVGDNTTVASGTAATQIALEKRLVNLLIALLAANHTDLAQLHTDLAGARSSAITATPDRFTNIGANSTLNVKASGGNVFSLICHNANAAARYVQLHNTATVPVTTVGVPVYSFYVPAGAQIGIGSDIFTNPGVNLAAGIAFAFSTTRDVYTAATAGDGSTVIHYK